VIHYWFILSRCITPVTLFVFTQTNLSICLKHKLYNCLMMNHIIVVSDEHRDCRMVTSQSYQLWTLDREQGIVLYLVLVYLVLFFSLSLHYLCCSYVSVCLLRTSFKQV